MLMELKADIRNRPVIVAEDIIDTGRTLHYFIQELKKREPAEFSGPQSVEKSHEHSFLPC